MKTVLVTGYVHLPKNRRPASTYAELGAKLLGLGLPTVAYLDPAMTIPLPGNVTLQRTSFDDCWYRHLCTPGVVSPYGENATKDTLEAFAVWHQKVTWAAQALELTNADLAAWVDFGVFHMVRDGANMAQLSPQTDETFGDAIKSWFKTLDKATTNKITMSCVWPLSIDQPINCDAPQWFCTGAVFLLPRSLGPFIDKEVRKAAEEHIKNTGRGTWEVNTWAQVMQRHPDKFEPYYCNHNVHLFTEYKPKMKIAVYALAKNEEKHAAAWAESCKEADYRVVTDTGSTDKTPEILRAAGVTVHSGNVVPWRWDEAHNLSLHHVPSDADVCVRLDLDERFQPGWRAAIEQAWKPETTKLRYWYAWALNDDGTPRVQFPSDRVHSRSGYRWQGATHEGLVRWAGGEVFAWSDNLRILHYRSAGKKHSTDLELLKRAVQESPQDARMYWYYARQLDYENHADARKEFEKYLQMAGGSPTERAYACRALARLEPDKKVTWYEKSIQESPAQPEGYFELARHYHEKKDQLAALYWADKATSCSPTAKSHASDQAAYGAMAPDIASVNAFQLGLKQLALKYSREALARSPNDERLKKNLASLETEETH